MQKRERTVNLAIELFLWLCSLIIIVPLAMIILNSVKSVTESAVMSLRLPTEYHFENFLEILRDDKILRSFLNSVFLCAGSSSVTLVVSSLAAYVLSRNRSRFNRVIYIVFLLGLVAPINYITTVKVMQYLHLINTFAGAILLYICGQKYLVSGMTAGAVKG